MMMLATAIFPVYSKLKEDLAFRQEVTQRIGLGFKLPLNHPKKSIKSSEV